MSTVYKLLSQFNSNLSQGHLDAAKYVLRYLKGSASRGILFYQTGNSLASTVAIPPELRLENLFAFTDSNWGPQDASKPKENETRTVTMEELRSIQGYIITRMSGPICWNVVREKRGSRSSCIAELKAIDASIKDIQFVRHLSNQLGLTDSSAPTPIFNDNQGSLDWISSGCKPTKKLRHENLAELGIAEAKLNDEVTFHWIQGKLNSADIFTKEDNDVQHFESIRDNIVERREDFGINFRHKLGVDSHSRGVLNMHLGDAYDPAEFNKFSNDKMAHNPINEWPESDQFYTIGSNHIPVALE